MKKIKACEYKPEVCTTSLPTGNIVRNIVGGINPAFRVSVRENVKNGLAASDITRQQLKQNELI